MSDIMMPLPPDALSWRTKLFELCDPITLPPEKFDEIWPLVDSVYSKTQGELLQNNGTVRVQKYECRLRKSTKSSTARPNTDDKTIKRRHSSIREKHLCHVRMKISRLVDGRQTVTVERLDEHAHSHDIEESFRVKKPTMLLNLLKAEVAKNYSASQIYHTFRGAGTPEGSTRLEQIGGASLKR